MKDVFESALKRVKQPTGSSWEESDARGMSPLKIPEAFKPPREPKAPTVTKEPSIPKVTASPTPPASSYAAAGQRQPQKPPEQPTYSAAQFCPSTTAPKPQDFRSQAENQVTPLETFEKGFNTAGNVLKATNPMDKLYGLVDAAVNLTAKNVQEQAELREENAAKIADLSKDRTPENAKEIMRLYATRQPRNFIAEALFQDYQPQVSGITKQAKEQKAEATKALMQDKSEAAKLAIDIGLSGADMATTAAISRLTGIPYLVLQGLFTGAETANNTLAEGYDAEKALTAAVASGGATAAIESFGGIGGNVGGKLLGKLATSPLGKAALSKVPELVPYLNKLSGSAVGKILGNAGAEAFEEFTEYDVQRVLNNVILDKDTPRDIREQLRNSFIGFVLGGTFGSYRAGQDNYNQVQALQEADWQAVADYKAQGNAIRRDVGEVGIERLPNTPPTTDATLNWLTNADLPNYVATGKKLSTRNEKGRMVEQGTSPIIRSEEEAKAFIEDSIDGKTVVQLGKKINGYTIITEIVSNERNSVRF